MTSLYSLRQGSAPDQYIVTKFDLDYNMESMYGLSAEGCLCPAGHRSTCRHRKMLPLFLQHNHVDDGWFLDWDTRLWRKPLSEPAPLSTEDKPTPPIVGGFPDWCLIEQCSTPNDCILNGCVLGHGTPPRSTVETAIAHSFESESSKSALSLADEQIFTCVKCEANYTVPSLTTECPVCGYRPLAPQAEPSPAPASLAPASPSVSRSAGVGATPFKKRKITL